MNKHRQQAKRAIRAFMQTHYTDAKLVETLEHARSGQLSYHSCCCFIGIPTAAHELQGMCFANGHYYQALQLPGAFDAEAGFQLLAYDREYVDRDGAGDDAARRRRFIPMILAEIRRRERLRTHDNIFASASSGDNSATPESLLQH